MKFIHLVTFTFLFFVVSAKTDSLSGVWLNNRYFHLNGCRQNGMAGGGASLADDENLLFLNPAGLGIENKRFKKLSFSYGNKFEPHRDWSYLIQDHYLSSCFQPFKSHVGGFSFLIDFYVLTQKENFPQTIYDPISGQETFVGDSLSGNQLNTMSIIGYGRDLSFMNLDNHSIGIAVVLNSRLFSNFGEPVGIGSMHMNVGYTGSFSNFFHIGFVVINIPIVKSFDSDIEIVTPFGIAPSIGFNPVFVKRNNLDAIKLFAEVSYKIAIENHEAYETDINKFLKNHFLNLGYEFGINELLFLRNGYRWILDNELDLNKFEISSGIGLNNRKHFEFNFHYSLLIYTYDNVDIDPASRIGISINFFNLSKKSKSKTF